MPQTIHKHVLTPLLPTTQIVEVLDRGIISTSAQGDDIVVWSKGWPDRPRIRRRVAVVGTGHDAPGDWHFVGTVLLYGGRLVFHVFEACEEAQP